MSPSLRTSGECARGADGRRGFTLIEALVAVTVIGLLVGLLLPAVQSAREAARRMQCASNLRQIGVAMNGYNTDQNMFPPSQLVTGVANDRRSLYSSNSMSGLTYLLPYLEQVPLYDSINMTFANIESPEFPIVENATARNARLAVFLCPSDGGPDILNNYRWNRGRFTGSGRPIADGPFGFLVLPRTAAITDGLSRTAFVSERIGGSFAGDSYNRPRDVRYPVGSIMYDSDQQFIPLCLAAEPSGWLTVSGRYWYYSGCLFTSYTHNGTPNDPRPSCCVGVLNDVPCGLAPPRSFHPGCVNVLFGDGHIEAIADSIDQRAWIALGTYNAGDF
jgi:prepilin-type N-terminal cleavage/methylation domain-containing protein/prepilin-type processing-associated H-X9-DG protein